MSFNKLIKDSLSLNKINFKDKVQLGWLCRKFRTARKDWCENTGKSNLMYTLPACLLNILICCFSSSKSNINLIIKQVYY